MRIHGHLFLFVCLVLIGFEGPGANAMDPGPEPSDTREATTPVAVAEPAAFPASRWAPADESRQDLDDVPATAAASVWDRAPSPSGLRTQSAAWLNFRRPFAETVSYRTTAPPSRVS